MWDQADPSHLHHFQLFSFFFFGQNSQLTSRKHLLLLFLSPPPFDRLSSVDLASRTTATASAEFTTLGNLHMQRAQVKSKSKTGKLTLSEISTTLYNFGIRQAWVSKETKTIKAVYFLFCSPFFPDMLQQSMKCLQLLGFVTVNVLQCFQLFDQCLVLVFQHSYAVFQTFDVFFLFPAALARCLPAEKRGETPTVSDETDKTTTLV